MTVGELSRILASDGLDPAGNVVILREDDVIKRIQSIHIRGWGSVEISEGPACRNGRVVGKVCFCNDESSE